MKTLIEMAREAGFNLEQVFLLQVTGIDEDLERLVEIARADERETIDQLVNDDKDLSDIDAIRISKAIRARANK